jgi:hypothetical protein
VFGELLSQPSRLAPNAAVDATVGQMVAVGLATSATVLCTSLLRSATKCDPCPVPFSPLLAQHLETAYLTYSHFPQR